MKFLFSALLVFFLAVLSAGEITLDKEWRIVLPVSGKIQPWNGICAAARFCSGTP